MFSAEAYTKLKFFIGQRAGIASLSGGEDSKPSASLLVRSTGSGADCLSLSNCFGDRKSVFINFFSFVMQVTEFFQQGKRRNSFSKGEGTSF